MNSVQKLQHASQAERGYLTDLGKLLREMSDPTSPVKLPTYAVDDLPAAGSFTGHVVYCADGAGGNPILAFSDGSNWLRSDTGMAVADA